MKIKLEIQPQYKEMEIHICSQEDSIQVRNVLQTVKGVFDIDVMAYSDTGVTVLNSSDIIRIYAQNKQVYADISGHGSEDHNSSFRLHERLYELEERLQKNRFIRISNSEIVNMRKIQRLDTSMTGTVKIFLTDGIQTYVSRRYISKIKEALGI